MQGQSSAVKRPRHEDKDDADMEALCEAAETGNVRAAKELVAKGLDPTTTNKDLVSPLMIACNNLQFEVAHYFLDIMEAKVSLKYVYYSCLTIIRPRKLFVPFAWINAKSLFKRDVATCSARNAFNTFTLLKRATRSAAPTAEKRSNTCNISYLFVVI